MWVTLKPVYILKPCIASCTVIVTLIPLSASAHILDSYMHRSTHSKLKQAKKKNNKNTTYVHKTKK